MEKKEKQSSGGYLLPILLVSMLIACAGLVFAIYTQQEQAKELGLLKTQIHELEKLVQALQLSCNGGDIQVGDSFSCLKRAWILPQTCF